MSDNKRGLSRWAVGLLVTTAIAIFGVAGSLLSERGTVMADIVNMKENIQSIEQDNADQEQALNEVQVDVARLVADTEWIRRTLERHYGE